MLPKNKLGNQMFKKLKVYKGDNHPHESQNPIVVDFAKINKKNFISLN